MIFGPENPKLELSSSSCSVISQSLQQNLLSLRLFEFEKPSLMLSATASPDDTEENSEASPSQARLAIRIKTTK